MAKRTLCAHGRKLCFTCIEPDDRAKNCYDTIMQLVHDIDVDTRMFAHAWVAIRLSDGGSDGQLYDKKQAAVRFQLHEMQCAYFSFRFAPNGFSSAKEAAIFLAWHEAAYDAGMRLPDPDAADGGADLIMPFSTEHVQNQMTRLVN